jgi:predicted dehydrogenase
VSARHGRAREAGRAKTGQSVIGHAVIGLGYMGQVHLAALAHARANGVACRLAGVCDQSAERLDGRARASGNLAKSRGAKRLFDPARVHATTDVDALLADPAVDSVSICTHTASHVELTRAALAAGKHVLVEKPVALDAVSIARLALAARKARRVVMPAMCMRFWPGWAWLKERVAQRTFGAVRSATFQRLASPPAWSPEFYADATRSGGALFDLHVHDADFVYWLFGRPASVSSTGGAEHVTTLYHYPRGPRHVVAEGGWDHTRGFAFTMRFVVVFEHATADFDLARKDVLRLSRGGASARVALPEGDGYRHEMRHFLGAVARGAPTVEPSLAEAAEVTRLLATELESAARGKVIACGGRR